MALEYLRTIDSMLADGSELLKINKLAINEVNIATSEEDDEHFKAAKSPRMTNVKPEHFRFVEPLSDA